MGPALVLLFVAIVLAVAYVVLKISREKKERKIVSIKPKPAVAPNRSRGEADEAQYLRQKLEEQYIRQLEQETLKIDRSGIRNRSSTINPGDYYG